MKTRYLLRCINPGLEEIGLSGLAVDFDHTLPIGFFFVSYKEGSFVSGDVVILYDEDGHTGDEIYSE